MYLHVYRRMKRKTKGTFRRKTNRTENLVREINAWDDKVGLNKRVRVFEGTKIVTQLKISGIHFVKVSNE